MKILNVVRMYYPVIGGNEIHIKELSEKFVEYGEDVTVFTSDAVHEMALNNRDYRKKSLATKEVVNGVTLKRFPVNYRLREILFDFLPKIRGGYKLSHITFKDVFDKLREGPVIPRLIWEINKFKPDIVLGANLWGAQVLYCYWAKKINNFPLVVMPCLHIGKKWVENSILYKILNFADLIIALTDFEKAYLMQKGIDGDKIFVTGVGIDPFKFNGNNGKNFRKKYGIYDEPIVAFVGRKWNYKGVGTLIDAMEIVWQKVPDIRLILAGATTYDDLSIRSKIASLEIEKKKKIISIDNFSEEEKSDIFSSCDIFAMPSKFESFGIVYLEAWLHKKPIIACKDSPPATVIEEGKDGLLVEYDNRKDLADAILNLLNNKQKRDELGEKGREKLLSNYTWDIVAKRIRERYYKLLNGSKVKRR